METGTTRPVSRQPEKKEGGQIALDASVRELLRRAEAARAEAEAARADAEAARQRQTFLANAADLLASSLDFQETIDKVAHACLGLLADYCVVDLLDSQGKLCRTAVAHSDPRKEAVCWEMARRYPPNPRRGGGYNRVFQTGEPLLAQEFTEALLEETAEGPDHREMLREVGFRTYMILPLHARGRMLGALFVGRSDGNLPYTMDDLAFAHELARRFALAVDNARLYDESRQAVEKLEETVAFLDTLVTSASLGIGFVDRHLRFMRVNDALAAMNGFTVEEHLGRTVRQIVPEMADQAEQAVLSVMERQVPLVNWELSGGTRHWLGGIYPVTRRGGDVLGVGVIAADITERKRMEEALRESEGLLRDQQGILEKVAAGAPLHEVLVALARFVEGHIPRSGCTILLKDGHSDSMRCAVAPVCCPGCSERDGLGTEVLFLNEEVPGPSWGRCWTSLCEMGWMQVGSAQLLSPSGKEFGELVVLRPGMFHLEADELRVMETAARLAGLAIERRQMEEGEAQKLHLLIQNLADGVVAVSPNSRLLFVNPTAGRLLAIDPTVGVTPHEAGFPPQLAEALHRVSEPGVREPTVLSFTHNAVEIEAQISPVVTELSHHGALAILRDVTSQSIYRRMQESFVANVSHELRGPLATLSVTLEAVADGLIPEREKDRYLRAMLVEMERLRRLSHDVLELTRMDAGALQVKAAELDLVQLLDAVEANWRQRCLRQGIQLTVARCNLRVKADSQRVEQVIANLLDNAVRFTPGGGRIDLGVRREGKRIRISVSDTGVGIPEEHIPHLWARFYKVDSARTRTPQSGTGLGLSIVKQLVEAMGGQVGVESRVDQGSTFSFTLLLA